jgi:hypothetical protein
LIVVACLVEMGEVIARLVVHATSKKAMMVTVPPGLDRESVLRMLDGMVAASAGHY